MAVFANMNPARFHDPSGGGYRFLADQILATDTFNPNIAARLLEPLGQWARYAPELGEKMRAELERNLIIARRSNPRGRQLPPSRSSRLWSTRNSTSLRRVTTK